MTRMSTEHWKDSCDFYDYVEEECRIPWKQVPLLLAFPSKGNVWLETRRSRETIKWYGGCHKFRIGYCLQSVIHGYSKQEGACFLRFILTVLGNWICLSLNVLHSICYMAWMMEFWRSVFIVESNFLMVVENGLGSVWVLHDEITEAKDNLSGHLEAIWVFSPTLIADFSSLHALPCCSKIKTHLPSVTKSILCKSSICMFS